MAGDDGSIDMLMIDEVSEGSLEVSDKRAPIACSPGNAAHRLRNRCRRDDTLAAEEELVVLPDHPLFGCLAGKERDHGRRTTRWSDHAADPLDALPHGVASRHDHCELGIWEIDSLVEGPDCDEHARETTAKVPQRPTAGFHPPSARRRPRADSQEGRLQCGSSRHERRGHRRTRRAGAAPARALSLPPWLLRISHVGNELGLAIVQRWGAAEKFRSARETCACEELCHCVTEHPGVIGLRHQIVAVVSEIAELKTGLRVTLLCVQHQLETLPVVVIRTRRKQLGGIFEQVEPPSWSSP